MFQALIHKRLKQQRQQKQTNKQNKINNNNNNNNKNLTKNPALYLFITETQSRNK